VGNSDVYIANGASNKFLQLKHTGELKYDDKAIYHEGISPPPMMSARYRPKVQRKPQRNSPPREKLQVWILTVPKISPENLESG
jgi:hypothetical protein